MNGPPSILFVYGTLMFDEILLALTGRTFPTRPATLQGFARHTIVRRGEPETYPAIRRRASANVRGRLLLGVDDASMRWIDCYENDPPEYERVSVRLECDGGDPVQAATYVARPILHPFLTGEWYPDRFERDHLTEYVQELIPQLRCKVGNERRVQRPFP